MMRALVFPDLVPTQAASYDLRGQRFAGPPIASGASPARGDDWSVVRAPTPATFPTVDFSGPLLPDTAAWIVGWLRRDNGEATTYERIGFAARVTGPVTGSDLWTLSGMGDEIHAGLSGAPVVVWDAARDGPRIVGMYTATVKTTKSFLGIPMGTATTNVFIRPPVSRSRSAARAGR